tara:strand:- start:179 stop:520 length:342 start_codon:yes stop_codon:yes gene_type:complete
MARARPNNSNSSASTGGVIVVGMIQIVFIILKLTKTGIVSSWPWWKVMLPIICSVGLVSCCGLTACFMTATWFAYKNDDDTKNQVAIDQDQTRTALVASIRHTTTGQGNPENV